MFKLYTSETFVEDDFVDDPDLACSAGNRFTSCVFPAVVTGVNFSGARFDNNCDFATNDTVFDNCNFINMDLSGSGFDPSNHGATFTQCSTGTFANPSPDDGTPALRNAGITPTLLRTTLASGTFSVLEHTDLIDRL